MGKWNDRIKNNGSLIGVCISFPIFIAVLYRNGIELAVGVMVFYLLTETSRITDEMRSMRRYMDQIKRQKEKP